MIRSSILKSLVLITSMTLAVGAQTSVSDLAPAHAAEVERYMSANKGVTFRPSSNLSDEYLTTMRESMGKEFKPNYAVGDFNRDGRGDFAVLLYRKGEPVTNEGITSEEHSTDYPLRLVVFNGSRTGFRVVYTTDLMGPPAAFIAFDKKLHYGIFETDADMFLLSPAGRGYVMKPR